MSDPTDHNDPFDRLHDFDPGVPMTPLPPAEVRRRGDRRRHRATALGVVAAVAVVAVIATPLAVLAGGGDRDSAPDFTTDSPTATASASLSDALLTADELPTRTRLTPWQALPDDGEPTLACQPTDDLTRMLGADASATAVFGAKVAGPPDVNGDLLIASRIRTTVLQFEGSTIAAGITARLWIDECGADPEAHADGGVHHTDAGTWRTYDYPAPDMCTDCDTVRFDRMGVLETGDRLVLVSLAEVGGPVEPKGLDQTMRELMTAAAAKAAGTFELTPSASPTVAPTSAPTSAAVDLADVPIDHGLTADTADGGEKVGPSADAKTLALPDSFCGQDLWPASGSTDRIAVSVSGPEYYESRELVRFPSGDDAARVIDRIRTAAQECEGTRPGQDPLTFHVIPDQTGENSVSFGFTYYEGLGGNVYQFMQIGDLVLMQANSGEYDAKSELAGVRGLTKDTAYFVNLRCLYAGTC